MLDTAISAPAVHERLAIPAAVAAAVLNAGVAAVQVLAPAQPAAGHHFVRASDYVIEILFAASLLITACAVLLLARYLREFGQWGTFGMVAASAYALGTGLAAISSAATAARGVETLDVIQLPAIGIWLVAGLLMAIATVRARVLPIVVGLGFAAGLPAAMALGNSGPLAPSMLGGAAVFLVAAFVRREGRTRAPMIDLRLFRNLDFAAGIASGLLSYLVLFGTLFVVPFFLEHARHLSPTRAGLELGALPVALAVVAPFAGRARDRVGARIPTVSGLVLAAVLLAALAVSDRSSISVVVLLAGIGAGLGLFTPANNAAIMTAAPREHSGMAGGVLNLTRGLGTALGVAVTGLTLGLRNAQRPLASAHAVTVGFETCVLVLSAIALTAAGIASLRAPRAPSTYSSD